jgi:hypothetical protein
MCKAVKLLNVIGWSPKSSFIYALIASMEAGQQLRLAAPSGNTA